ncbi:MAG TPA: polynucleotide adenylyltransferase PcnB [Geobacteraceae bacterium]|nr:polynucleotide adenylyltransferase PcnB [Geobacteraceae bacterium]
MKTGKPVILKRAEHNISRQLVSPNALRVLYRLRDSGYTACLVGGCVRDLLLGREPKDFDIATDATPGELKKLFRNCRLVGRRFRLAHIHFRDEIIEVATFRASAADVELEPAENDIDSEGGDESGGADDQTFILKSDEGVLLRDNLFGSPEEDAWRRDFTVNALSYNIADFSIVDYVGGVEDLNLGIIRTIGDPWDRFTEDPVRMLRAVRFSAQLGFTIEKSCWQAIVEMAERICLAAPPRLFDELMKMFLSGEGEQCYQLLRQCGMFAALFPFLEEWLAREEGGFPHTTLSEALLRVDEQVGRGEKPTAPLFLAMFFGSYLEEKAMELRQDGAAPQESIEMAIASLMAATVPRVSITQRVAFRLREIMILQLRFARMPGRKPQSVIARPAFAEALDFFRFRSSTNRELMKSCVWWESYAAGIVPEEMPEKRRDGDTGGGGSGRRKRRRRRRRPTASP